MCYTLCMLWTHILTYARILDILSFILLYAFKHPVICPDLV